MSLKINENLSVGKASAILAGMIFLSRLAGFGRNLLTSHFYGSGPEADAFNAAFAVPEMMSIVIAGGALATGFVPTFSAFLAKGEYEKAKHTFASLLSILFVFAAFVTLALIGLSYTPFIGILAPASAPVELYASNLRLLLFAQFFFIIGGVFTGAFNSLRYFWMPALQPVFFNVGIIVFGLIGALTMGHTDPAKGVLWQSYGAIFGAIIGSILLQVPFALKAGLSLKPTFDWKDEGAQKVLRALIPVFFGLASGRILSLSLPVLLAPDPTSITNASRLAILPLELIASGSAIAIFPTISQLAAQGKFQDVSKQLGAVMRRVLKLISIATIGLIVVAPLLIKILFQHGKFSATDAELTAQVLRITALALPGLAVQQLLARGFYALNDTKTPTIAGIGAMTGFGVLSYLLGGYGTIGITIASVISVTVLALVLWRGLEKRLNTKLLSSR
jgi:putative peptidoglycan lipid II flippase